MSVVSVFRPSALVSSVSSDAHTWNLVYLQLVLEEAGFTVVNIGSCIPDHPVVRLCHPGACGSP